jgi:hypothetical protein
VQEIVRVIGFDAQGYYLSPPLVPDFPLLNPSMLPAEEPEADSSLIPGEPT